MTFPKMGYSSYSEFWGDKKEKKITIARTDGGIQTHSTEINY